MEEFRDILVVHERLDWGRVVQRLMDMDMDVFPYDYVHHMGTERLMHMPSSWKYTEVVMGDGRLVWSSADGCGELSALLEELNPTYYCSLFRAHLI